MFRNKKATLLSGLLLAALAVSLASAVARYITVFDKVQLNQNAILDSSGTTRLSVGSTNAITGNATISGTLNVTGATTLGGGSTGTFDSATITTSSGSVVNVAGSLRFMPSAFVLNTATATLVPSIVGQVIISKNAAATTAVMIISTGTTAGAWVAIGTQS